MINSPSFIATRPARDQNSISPEKPLTETNQAADFKDIISPAIEETDGDRSSHDQTINTLRTDLELAELPDSALLSNSLTSSEVEMNKGKLAHFGTAGSDLQIGSGTTVIATTIPTVSAVDAPLLEPTSFETTPEELPSKMTHAEMRQALVSTASEEATLHNTGPSQIARDNQPTAHDFAQKIEPDTVKTPGKGLVAASPMSDTHPRLTSNTNKGATDIAATPTTPVNDIPRSAHKPATEAEPNIIRHRSDDVLSKPVDTKRLDAQTAQTDPAPISSALDMDAIKIAVTDTSPTMQNVTALGATAGIAPQVSGTPQVTAPMLPIPTMPPQAIVGVLTEQLGSGSDMQDRIVVQLDPPELGRVSIDFKFDANGVQSVIITGETPEALKQLRQMHFELVQSLEQNGLSSRDLSFAEQQSQQSPALPDGSYIDTVEGQSEDSLDQGDEPILPPRNNSARSSLDLKL